MHRMTVGMAVTTRRKTCFPTVGTTGTTKAKPPAVTTAFCVYFSPVWVEQIKAHSGMPTSSGNSVGVPWAEKPLIALLLRKELLEEEELIVYAVVPILRIVGTGTQDEIVVDATAEQTLVERLVALEEIGRASRRERV